MTVQFQSRRLRLWYESIPKPFRSRWIIGLLVSGGLVSVGFGVYRNVTEIRRYLMVRSISL
jgi:hypothetical protein